MVVVIEILHHARPDEEGIVYGPGREAVLHQAEFEGQVVAVRLQECVHSASVRVEVGAITGGEISSRLLRQQR